MLLSSISFEMPFTAYIFQSVLLREIKWVDPTDDVADSLVIGTKVYFDEVDLFINSPWYKQLLMGAPKAPIRLSEDSSTGLGQIFSNTAVNALNWYYDMQIDANNRNQRFDIWEKLRTDDAYNIDMVALVLLHNAEGLLGINAQTTSPDEIKKILARYNGFGSGAETYGNETYEYYKAFLKLNSIQECD